MSRSDKAEVPDDLTRAIAEQRRAFIEKFGREPVAADPMFFDPDADEPRPIDPIKVVNRMLGAMIAAETPPRLIFAFERTGLILSADGYRRAPSEVQAEWEDAMDEWVSMSRPKRRAFLSEIKRRVRSS